jgi:acetyl esterase/lipase
MLEQDVEYISRAEKPLLARFYRPEGKGPFAAVVDVHGGAWTSGDRLNNAAIDKVLAEAGVAVLALDFRMPPEAGYPAAVEDVRAGIDWLHAHAAEYGVNPALIGGVGTSSGAQTLLLALLRGANLKYVVACWPIADPVARYRMAREKGNAKLVSAHDAYWVTEAAMAEGSPQHILERGAPVALPPLFIAQGTNDDNVTPDMADKFAAAYRQRGGAVELRKYDGQPHSFIKEPLSEPSRQALEAIRAFVRDQT